MHSCSRSGFALGDLELHGPEESESEWLMTEACTVFFRHLRLNDI